MIARRRLGAVLGLNQLLTWGMSFYLPAILATPAAADLGTEPVAVVAAFSWSLLVSGACAPRVGRWIDRHGGRGALLASIVIIAAGQAILAAAPSLPVWYAGWTVIGLGMSMGLYDAAFATVGGLLQREAGPTITGITLIAGFASTVFWTLGAALIGPLGWRGLMLAYAALMLCTNLPMVWMLVPPASARPRAAATVTATGAARAGRGQAICLAGFFALRWLITSAIAVHILHLMHGIGLSLAQAVLVGSLIGPGQVIGRIMEWTIGRRVSLLSRARLGALLFPLGTLVLLAGGPVAAAGFALLYGMSNGILTINRGTLPLALFGPAGYATMLGWFAVPVQVAQALAPTLAAPLVTALPALHVLLLAGGMALLAVILLLPLRLPAAEA
ncbi:MAG: MFS transporter [Acetobacteraceae bacterium]